MISITMPFFECPHCHKTYPYKKPNEREKHIKNCPSQFQNPKERFKQELINSKKRQWK